MGRWHGPGQYLMEGFSLAARPRQRLRAIKRLEAEERNAATPPERRKAYRRQLELAAAAPKTTSKKRSNKD